MNFLARLTLLLLVTSTIGHTASIYNFGLLERVGMAIGRRMIDFVDHREWADRIKSDNGQYSLDFINKTHERFLNEELLNSSLITGLFIDCVDPIEDADRLTNPLVAALRNPSVTTVGLWNVQFTDESATAVAEALRHNTTLTELNFFACKNIGPIGEAIGDLLMNASLTHLYLAFTPINTPSAVSIAGSLKDNHTLNSLCLFRNELNEEGENIIAESFRNNTTLTDLHLTCSRTSEAGLDPIQFFLASNQNLRRLTLRGIHMGDPENFPIHFGWIKHIANMLKTNRSLLELDIQCNFMNDDSGSIILKSIQDHNTTLQCLRIAQYNDLNQNTLDAIDSVVKRNKEAQSYNKEWSIFENFDILFKSRFARGRDNSPPVL
ncbi:MAG: hypothetical protein NTX76_03600 [Alphaproteobacteria bacterium]|nr:hypothetical protein [Alphaproteobacteria bacterium]